ncbi:MAG: inorganic phosphate transporter, partial [Deltaproteobacteria bacterium]|nr:inorganic phosphate transporter [Deltaproteobacteria bacterium]
MDLINILLIALSVFFALNMGGSGMAPSFSVAIGANIIKRRYAVILFTVFVCFGSLVFGKFVVKTLGSDLVPAENLDPLTVLIVIFSASSSLFLANILKIPQSTSWVTVFAISAVGIYHSSLKTGTLLYKLLPAWILLPLFSFLLTLGILKAFYPLRAWNFRFYEYLSKHEFKMKIFVIAGSCYVAFAIGSNNVANIVRPLS